LTSIPGASWFGRHGERPGIIPSAVAVGTTLIYAAMKIVMAIEDKLGLPGFPAPAASYANRPDIAHSEWMLVGMAFLAVGVAFIMIVPWGVYLPRWLLASAIWIAGISLAAGAIRMTLRALRIPQNSEPAHRESRPGCCCWCWTQAPARARSPGSSLPFMPPDTDTQRPRRLNPATDRARSGNLYVRTSRRNVRTIVRRACRRSASGNLSCVGSNAPRERAISHSIQR